MEGRVVRRWAACVTLMVGLQACGSSPAEMGVPGKLPTVAAPFMGGTPPPTAVLSSQGVVTESPYFARSRFTPPPTRTRMPTSTPQEDAIRERSGAVLEPRATPSAPFTETLIYDEALDANWSLDHSLGMSYTLSDTTRPYTGAVALAITPLAPFGTLFFTVREGITDSFPYARVLGARFAINSGDDYLDTDQLAVTVLGSNAYPYWRADDGSVETSREQFFSETRLYYLDVNRSIPPNTWVEITVWLDSLPYDPEYEYVTGLYLKNDRGLSRTIYVDRVSLLMTQ